MRNTYLTVRGDASNEERLRTLETAVSSSPGLANLPIQSSITFFGEKWGDLTGQERSAVLAAAERHGDVGLRREPLEWRLHVGLARLYQRASLTEGTELLQRARRHTDSALVIAPERIEVVYLEVLQHGFEGNPEGGLNALDDFIERSGGTLVEGSRIDREITEIRGFLERQR